MRVSSGFLARRTPGIHIFGNIHTCSGFADLQGAAGINHHRHFIDKGGRIGLRLFQRLGMRAVGEAARMQSDHALLDIVAAEEVAPVVEQHFVVVVVVVIERHLQRAGVAFHWARSKGADHKTIGDKGGVRRRRQVITVAHQRANIAPVEAYHGVVAMPADHIQWVVGVSHSADLTTTLDANLPGVLVLLGLEGVIDARMIEHCRVEDRLRAEQALVRQLISTIGAFDQQHKGRLAGLYAPRGATRNQRAIALAGNIIEVERMRAQRPLPVDPTGRRMLVVQVRRGAEKTLAAHLALVGAFGKVAVRLARTLAFTQGKTDPVTAHNRTPSWINPAPVAGPNPLSVRGNYAALDLVFLDGLEQRLEVALATALVTLALDDLEEDRANHCIGENLQQDAVITRRAVDQDAQFAQYIRRLAMPGHAGVDFVVVGAGSDHKIHAIGPQLAHGGVDILAAQGNMLDALALIFANKFLDLRLVVGRLVDRDANLAARRGHGARQQAGELAFDVEVADLAEVGDALVEPRPHVHLPTLDVVGQVIQLFQANRIVVRCAAFDVLEVDVVDGLVAEAVHQIQQGAADALDAGNIQLAKIGVATDQFGALGFHVGSGLGGVLHAEGHGAGTRAVLQTEFTHVPSRAAVQHEVDVVLLEQPDLFRAVLGGFGEAHGCEQLTQLLDAFGGRCGVFDELEAVGTDRVVLFDLVHGVHCASSLLF